MRPASYVLLGVLLVPTVGLVGDIVTDGRLKSTLSTGAPLQVASDDVVLNLNADMVDGVEGTDLYTKAEVDALVAAAAAGDSRRWFYATTTFHNGANADSACDVGFHMASMWEILDMSNLRYDAARGLTGPDSGSGVPQRSVGWIKTGDLSTGSGPAGLANCFSWTVSTDSDYGTWVWLDDPATSGWNSAASRISPWTAYTSPCDIENPVWCIQD